MRGANRNTVPQQKHTYDPLNHPHATRKSQRRCLPYLLREFSATNMSDRRDCGSSPLSHPLDGSHQFTLRQAPHCVEGVGTIAQTNRPDHVVHTTQFVPWCTVPVTRGQCSVVWCVGVCTRHLNHTVLHDPARGRTAVGCHWLSS